MKTIVVYYSNKGSNKYLAEKISRNLSSNLEEIKPRLNIFPLQLMNIHLGIKPLKTNIEAYDKVILCGPIWMGKLIPPLRSFLKTYFENINTLVFVSCCGSTFEKKDEKFGHNLVFKNVKGLLKDKCIFCQAFPINLVLPNDKEIDNDVLMKTHLNDANFKGEIADLFNSFIKRLTAPNIKY